MHIVYFTDDQGESWGVVDGDEIVDTGRASGVPAAFAAALRTSLDTAARVPMSGVRIRPPVTATSKIICVGLNYADHVLEMGRELPERPVIFTRFPDSLVGDGEPLIAPRRSTAFDYEGELALVIGLEARNVNAADAAQHILGYTVLNDGSLRDYQRHTHQFAPGKNFPASGACGPAIVTADEIGSLEGRAISTSVNGETLQSSTLDELIFSPAELVAYCSEWTTLRPGDIIATGTPGNVGDSFTPPKYLRPGDEVVVEIAGIGTLRNPVVAEA